MPELVSDRAFLWRGSRRVDVWAAAVTLQNNLIFTSCPKIQNIFLYEYVQINIKHTFVWGQL